MTISRPRPASPINHLLVAAALTGSALLGPLSGQSPAVPAKSDILVLPDIKVIGSPELPPPESWNYCRIEGFEVLSNASERATTRLLRDFTMFRQALGLAWPMPQRPTAASTLILCGRKDKFDGFVPLQGASSETGAASLFLRDLEQSAIVVDLQADIITLAGLQTPDGGMAGGVEVDADRQLYREYVRYLLNQSPGRMPAWLQEGIAQIVMAMEFTDRWIIFGKIDSSGHQPAPPAGEENEDAIETVDMGVSVVRDQPFNVALQRKRLLPLAELFAVRPDSPEARNPLGNNRWAKQSYAFVHLCLYGMNGRYQKAFGQFVQRLGREPAGEAMFKECFQKSYAEMNLELRAYIGFTNHQYQTITLKGDDRFGGPPPVLRAATEGEIGRIKGDAMRLAGRTDDAQLAYRAAYLRGDRDPALLAALGVAEAEAGRDDRARQFLEAAMQANVPRPSAYLALARLRLAEAKAKPAAGGGRLDEAQTTSVLAPLRTARSHPPPLPGIYEVIAETWLLDASTRKPEQLAVLTEGIRNFPGDIELVYRTAQLFHRAGDDKTATSLAQFGFRITNDTNIKARFMELLSTWSAPAAPAR